MKKGIEKRKKAEKEDRKHGKGNIRKTEEKREKKLNAYEITTNQPQLLDCI